MEHARRDLHPKLGEPLRQAGGKGAALVPSAKKIGLRRTGHRRAPSPQDAAFVRAIRRHRSASERCAGRTRLWWRWR